MSYILRLRALRMWHGHAIYDRYTLYFTLSRHVHDKLDRYTYDKADRHMLHLGAVARTGVIIYFFQEASRVRRVSGSSAEPCLRVETRRMALNLGDPERRSSSWS